MDRTRDGYRDGVSDDPSTEELKLEQVRREMRERANAEEAPSEEGERTAARRADKAAYLKRKLEDQETADEDQD